jgi:protein-(glutamine-N5) methyltransferase, release factor-specific
MRRFTVGEMVRICAGVIGGSEAEAEAREIMASVLNVSRSWPDLHSDQSVDEDATAESLFAARMRATGAPIQYCVGKAAFRHLTLVVNRSVLIPRPETEMLVDIVLSRAGEGTVADVGTGSGAIALALATEGQYDRVFGTDVSVDALEVARENAIALASQIKGAFELRSGSLLEPLRGETVDAIVSNPPYIADDEMEALPESVRDWEPVLALESGPEGLDATAQIIAGAPEVLRRGGLLALEVDSRRGERTADILKGDGRYEGIEILADLAGRDRFAVARRR